MSNVPNSWPARAYFRVQQLDAPAAAARAVFPLYAQMAHAAGDMIAAGAAQEWKHTLSCAVGGSAPSNPRYTINVGAGAYGISRLWVTNVTLDRTLELYLGVSSGDVIVIDCETLRVTVNGIDVDFAGVFPHLDPRAAATNTVELHVVAQAQPSIAINCDWTSRFQA